MTIYLTIEELEERIAETGHVLAHTETSRYMPELDRNAGHFNALVLKCSNGDVIRIAANSGSALSAELLDGLT